MNNPLIIRGTAALAALAVVVTSGLGFQHQVNAQSEARALAASAEVQWEEQQTAYLDAVGERSTALADLQSVVQSGHDVSEKVGGHVMDEKTTEALDKAVKAGDGLTRTQKRGTDVASQQANITELRVAAHDIRDASARASESHEAWEAEQKRIAEEKAAAARAAAEAAAAAQQAAAARASSSSAAPSYNTSAPSGQSSAGASAPQASAPAPAGANYTINVGTYCNGDTGCAQSAVDGSSFAYISYASTGLSEIAGHNYGPAGVIANFRPGTTVQVYGTGAGLYRVNSIVYVGKVTSADSVPSGFAFQTCVGSQMVLAYASRIG